LHGVALDGAEDQVFHDHADDDGQQAGEHRRNLQQIAVFEDEPAEPALPRRNATAGDR
jgi:hypothetical protein